MMAKQSRHRIGACDASTAAVTTRRAASPQPRAGGEAHAAASTSYREVKAAPTRPPHLTAATAAAQAGTAEHGGGPD